MPNITIKFFFLLIFIFSCEKKHSHSKLTPPPGMIYVPAGSVYSVNQNTSYFQKHKIKAFFMDATEVSVKEFKKFVQETNYTTDAEKIGDSLILKNTRWAIIKNAYWNNPLGGGQKAFDNHPVTHISYNDAINYCKWKKHSLPSKEEWEHAARNAINDKNTYPWGNELINPQKANTWQGSFPNYNSKEDGYLYTSPLKAFPKTGLGFWGLAGNVWEWTKTEYTNSFSQEPETQFITKGGSFLCLNKVCHGYKINEHQFQSRTSSSFHLGFRTIKYIKE